jgi:hypothetical protein
MLATTARRTAAIAAGTGKRGAAKASVRFGARGKWLAGCGKSRRARADGRAGHAIALSRRKSAR